jgi:NAD(P)H dehydrogenase (quinone)
MIKLRIIVTGATGKTGSVVVSELLKAGCPVRAMVHREDARSARLQASGAELAVADMSDVERVADALKNVQRASLLSAFRSVHDSGRGRLRGRRQGSPARTYCGPDPMAGEPLTSLAHDPQLWLVDRLFSMTPGVAHTIVRPGIFADAYLATIGLAVQLGIFPWMNGNSRNAPPSNEDIARVAVAALMDPARHGGKSYRPTGPELLSVEDMAKAIGRAVGRSVRFVPTRTWLFMKGARMSGYPIDLFSGIRYYIEDHERGAFELGAPTTGVLDVTGQPPEDFETIARRYATLPRNQRTLGNWLREFAQFMIAPLSPGFNLDRYDRELRRPFPSEPQFAPDSKVWRREHAIATPPSPQCREVTTSLSPPPVAVKGWNSKEETLSCHNK